MAAQRLAERVDLGDDGPPQVSRQRGDGASPTISQDACGMRFIYDKTRPPVFQTKLREFEQRRLVAVHGVNALDEDQGAIIVIPQFGPQIIQIVVREGYL